MPSQKTQTVAGNFLRWLWVPLQLNKFLWENLGLTVSSNKQHCAVIFDSNFQIRFYKFAFVTTIDYASDRLAWTTSFCDVWRHHIKNMFHGISLDCKIIQ